MLHLRFQSTQISGFLKISENFWNSVPNSRSKIRQTLLSGTGFSKNKVYLKKNISRFNFHIFSRPEKFIRIDWTFVLNNFEYCRRDT